MFLKTIKATFSNKILLIFLIISTILTAATSCFIYGVYQNYHTKITQGEIQGKTVTISALGYSDYNTSHTEYIEAFGEEDMSNEYSSVLKSDVVSTLMSLPENIMEDIDYVMCGATMDDNVYGLNFYHFEFKVTPEGLIPYGDSAKLFSDEQYLSGEKIAYAGQILFTDEASEYSTGTIYWINDGARKIESDEQFLEINGQQYKLLGEAEALDPEDMMIYIPFTSLDDDTPLRAMYNTVDITFKSTVTYRQYNEIQNAVNNVMPEKAYLQDMDLTFSADSFFYKTMVVISGVVTLLFSVNLVLIYSYAVSQNKKKIIIYRLCGCTKHKVIKMFIAQIALINIPVFLLAQFLFNKLLYPILLDYFPDMINSFSSTVYLLMFACYVLVSFVVLEIMLTINIGKKLEFSEGI